MANILTYLNNIKNALYGRDVRGSIHDGIKAINDEVESTTARQKQLEGTFDQLIINSGNSNAEIVAGRTNAEGKSFDTIGKRLDNTDSQIKDIEQQKADKTTTTDIQTQVNNLVLGAVGDGNNPEVIQARGDHIVLNDRFVSLEKLFDIDTNLFDKNNSEITIGKFINEDGVVKPLIETGISHYMKVFKNRTYSCSFYKNMFGTNTVVELCNSNKTKVTIIKAIEKEGRITFNIPNNDEIEYCRVNLLLSDIDNFVFKQGDNVDIKIPTLSNDFGFNAHQIKIIKNYTNNPLRDKIVSFNGDSIMFGAGFEGGFAKMIAEKNDMIYENIAVSGATISANTTFSNDGTNRHWICRSISNMRDDADYIIVEGGVNDKSLRTVTLGVITDGYNNVLDDTTFCGALESVCKQLIERYPDKKKGFVIPHRIWDVNDVWETSWYPSMTKILKKWGIPYLDLQNEIPSLNLIDSLKNIYTYKADGWHPNELGYRIYYCDKIESWMKTL